ncbi:MAG: phage tail protein [Planctomycetota bacterium]|jgi:microcystin-dependent protein
MKFKLVAIGAVLGALGVLSGIAVAQTQWFRNGRYVLPTRNMKGALEEILTDFEGRVAQNEADIAALQAMPDTTHPYLGLQYVIALNGLFPTGGGFGAGGASVGEIRLVPYGFIPDGWAACEGQILPIASYQALFSLLGTNFGGDGRTSFGLPDLRSRVVRGVGQGPGLPNITLGEQGGG